MRMPWQRLDGHQERQHSPEDSSYGEAGEKNRSTIKASHLLEPKDLPWCRQTMGLSGVHISPKFPWLPQESRQESGFGELRINVS